jgi:hypothetical protein
MARQPNLIERVGLALARNYVREALPDITGQVDQDDALYRRVTDTRRDLNPVTHRRAQDISLFLWRQNPMAKRVVEMIADFVVGADGLRFEAESDKVQRVIEDFWGDPVTNLADRFRDLVRDESIFGELALRRAVNDASGHSRLGLIDGFRIKDITLNKDNALIDDVMTLWTVEQGGQDEALKIVNWVDEDGGSWQGDAHFFAINRVTGQKRGTPDLFAIADFIDGWDQLLFNALERSSLINAFVFDVSLQGADDAGVQSWLSQHGEAPRPGSVRVHNEKEVWNALAPQLGSQDVMTIGRAIKNAALGGAGMPEAWFAEGDSANRSTLAEQGDPTYRMLQSRQQHVKTVARTLVGTALQSQMGKGLREARTKGGAVIRPAFRVIAPDLSSKDTSRLSAALPQVSAALSTAIQEQWIDRESSRSVFISMVNQLGVELDYDDVTAKVEAEQAKAKAEADKTAADQGAGAQAAADALDALLGPDVNADAALPSQRAVNKVARAKGNMPPPKGVPAKGLGAQAAVAAGLSPGPGRPKGSTTAVNLAKKRAASPNQPPQA